LSDEPPGIAGWAPQRRAPGREHEAAAAGDVGRGSEQGDGGGGGGGGAEPMAVDDAAPRSGGDVAARDQRGWAEQADAGPHVRQDPQQQQQQQQQQQGPLLAPSDFGAHLEGQRLLVFWPDDGRWDAGDVRVVDAATGRATIIYAQGAYQHARGAAGTGFCRRRLGLWPGRSSLPQHCCC
jgi:hypothetical protein